MLDRCLGHTAITHAHLLLRIIMQPRPAGVERKKERKKKRKKERKKVWIMREREKEKRLQSLLLCKYY